MQTLFNGIITGVIMTLPALAVTLLFGVLKFPNFAVGAMMTVAAYLAFACALAVRPKVLMLDEPSAGLSPILTSEVFDKVERVNRRGVSILIVEQNAIEALRISDTCIVLAGGRVRSCGPADAVLGMKDLNSLYLGADVL